MRPSRFVTSSRKLSVPSLSASDAILFSEKNVTVELGTVELSDNCLYVFLLANLPILSGTYKVKSVSTTLQNICNIL